VTHLVDPTLRPFHADVYAAIREAWLEHGFAPSQHELALACMCSSTTVINAIRELRKRGYIHAPKFAMRTVKPTDMERTISVEPLDPWGALVPKKYFKAAAE